MSGRIIDNPVNIRVSISKAGNGWNVTPSLTAFAKPQQPTRKNIIFVLDRSSSMAGAPLEKVKRAVKNLLDKLTGNDKFSIVTFNDEAEILTPRQRATQKAINTAKNQVDQMEANGGTSFTKAFAAVNDSMITDDSSIIFLTDGEHHCSADDLIGQFHERNVFPHVIPIGVCLKTSGNSRQLLNKLFTKTGGIGTAIFIEANDDSEAAYQHAFDTAFKLATEKSHAPAQLEMTIKAKKAADDLSKTMTAESMDKRELTNVSYDGLSSIGVTQYFPYSIPPSEIAVRFLCDRTSLSAEYLPTPGERAALINGQVINKNIPAFKWKDHSAYSWAIAIGATALGVLILAGVATTVITSPALALWTWQSLVEYALITLAGLYSLIKGTIALARKTIFLPTKLAAGEVKEEKAGLEEKKVAIQSLTSRIPSFDDIVQDLKDFKNRLPPFSSVKKYLAAGTLAAGGATMGYFGSTAIAASIFIPEGVSTMLFVTGCTLASAALLPLLAYGCWRLYSFASTYDNYPTKKTVAGCTLFAAGGATASYFGSTAYAASTILPAGVSASVFVASCTIAGAAILPLLAYGCWRLYSYASTHPKLPTKKSAAACTLFAASGATAGYLGSTASAASALIPAGVSASVFVASCTVAGAILLPLLAYGCWQLHNTCSSRQPAYRRY